MGPTSSSSRNAVQAEHLVAEARQRRLFFMEAMWMRCNPMVRRLQQLLGTGELGTVQQVRADLGFVVDKPDSLAATAALSELGVDLNIALSLAYRSGAVASLSASMTAWSPRTASIATELGRFDLSAAFHQPTTATWTSDGQTQTITEAVLGTGLANEALEVIRCLRSGETESPLVPHEESLAVMRLMDRIRADVGVRYPGE